MEIVKSEIYVCSKCGKEFLNSDKCMKHEADCKEGTQYRIVKLRPKMLTPELVSDVWYMPTSEVKGVETGTVFHWSDADGYEIYTFDLSEKEELRCKKMVLEEAIKNEQEAIIKHTAVLKPCERLVDEVYKRINEVEDESDHGA